MDSLPRTGEFYKDISDKTYQIVATATHAGTGERMVVYQALFGDFGVYTQPVQQFTENFKNQNGSEVVPEQNQQKTAGVIRAQQNTVGFLRNLQNPAGNYGNGQNPTGDNESSRSLAGNDGSGRSLAGNGESSRSLADNDGSSRSLAGNDESGQPPADDYKNPQNLATTDSQKDTDTLGYRPAAEDRAGVSSNYGSARGMQQKQRPRTQSPAEARRIMRQNQSKTDAFAGESYYDEKRRRQMEEREQRREMFRKSDRHESATEELRANPCLLKFLEADTYEEKFHVLNTIQNDMTDRLIDDIAVVLDVVIPEGPLNDRFYQLRNIILTRQKYETNRFR